MYKILERTIDYSGMLWSKNLDWIERSYGLFDVKYHDGAISSVGSDEPIDWWYASVDEIVNTHSDVTIDTKVENYQQTLINIHENFKKMLNNM